MTARHRITQLDQHHFRWLGDIDGQGRRPARRTTFGWQGPVEVPGTWTRVAPGSPIAAVPTFNDSSVKLLWSFNNEIWEVTYVAQAQQWSAPQSCRTTGAPAPRW